MSFGLSVFNDKGGEIVSTSVRPMFYEFRGTFKVTSQYSTGEGSGSIVFPRAITTQYRPYLFIRLVNWNRPTINILATFTGSPGNWTGANFRTGATTGINNLQNHDFEYVVCSLGNIPSPSGYGMAIFSEEGDVTFSSDRSLVTNARYTTTWSIIGTGSVNLLMRANFQVEADDFIDVGITLAPSMFSCSPSNQYFTVGVLYQGVRVVELFMTDAGGGRIYDLSNDNLNRIYCTPICKFPSDRYN